MEFTLNQILEFVQAIQDNFKFINNVLLPLPVNVIEIFKKGNKIKIKKLNRGKFTLSAKSAGMGVLEYARHVLANRDKYSSTLIKRANFARNAKSFKHDRKS